MRRRQVQLLLDGIERGFAALAPGGQRSGAETAIRSIFHLIIDEVRRPTPTEAQRLDQAIQLFRLGQYRRALDWTILIAAFESLTGFAPPRAFTPSLAELRAEFERAAGAPASMRVPGARACDRGFDARL
jgi:hypothetical protein